MKSEEITNRNSSQMRDNISRTPAPVRQLVEHFDHILANNANGEMKDISETENSFYDRNSVVVDTVHGAKALAHPVTPPISLAISSQFHDAAYRHSSPKPTIAQQMHQDLRETSAGSKPHIGNQSEISVDIEQITNEQAVGAVKNDNSVNFILPDGEAYRKLLMEARTTLHLLCDQAKNDLLNEEDMPEHAAGTLRTAIGKANLLLDKKMAKFEDLVKNHLDKNSNMQEVKLTDLSGYWALISIELKELETIFREVRFLRENHWTHPDSELSPVRIDPNPNFITADENHADGIKKTLPNLPMINVEKAAFEVERRQKALAEAKQRQKKLKKAEEEEHGERNGCGGTRMVI